MSTNNILMNTHPLTQYASGVYTAGAQGNSLVVDLGETLLLVDTGPGGALTEALIAQVRGDLGKPVSHIVYSHGHMGYNNGVSEWLADAERRGEPAPQIVAHERVPHRYRRYRETAGLQSYTNTRQFRSPYPAEPPAHWFRMPDVTYTERMVIEGSARSVELISAPGETDDGTAVWVPDVRALYGSNALINVCPNAGSPYRILREPLRWADTFDRFLALDPRLLIPEFGKPVSDPALIREALEVPARALRYLRDEVVKRMNAGMGEIEILHDVALPDELFKSRFMKPSYGCAEFIMRDVWRSENGWWNRNPTDLHPAAPADAARAVREALPEQRRVIERALELQRDGQTQLALHVIDLLANDRGDDPLVVEARALKARLCEQRAEQVSSVVSRHLYLSSADELVGRPIGAAERARGERSYTWQ